MPELDPRWAALLATAAAAAAHVPRVLAFEYAATAVGQPFDVARILLQVQWSPQRHAAARLAHEADASSETMVAGTAYRLVLSGPPAPPSPPPAPAPAPELEPALASASPPAPEQSPQPAPRPAELQSPPSDLKIVSCTPSGPHPPYPKQLTGPDAGPDDADAGAVLASVWGDPPHDESRCESTSRPSTPSPELWPEAEADWASDDIPAPDEDKRMAPPQLTSETAVPLSVLHPPPELGESIEQIQAAPTPPPASPFASPLVSHSAFPETSQRPTSLSLDPLSPPEPRLEERRALPIIYSGGLWDMARAVVRGPEGWCALFKGTSTTFVLEALERIMVPSFHRLLAAVTGLPSAAAGLALAVRGGGGAAVAGAALALAPCPWRAWGAAALSHAVVRMALVPLDTLRTRTVAQSILPGKRKYPAPWGTLPGLRMMADEEGGWAKLWLAPHIFWPALLDCTIRPCILLVTPLAVDKLLPYDGAQPATTARVLLSLACQISALFITLPIEAVRRRTQIQPHFDITHHARALATRREGFPVEELPDAIDQPERNGGSVLPLMKPVPISQSGIGHMIRIKGLRTCVETRPLPYGGVMDALLRIVREETSTPPWTMADPNAPMPTSGIYSLYRGFSIASMTLLAEAALALLLGEATPTGIWAEV